MPSSTARSGDPADAPEHGGDGAGREDVAPAVAEEEDDDRDRTEDGECLEQVPGPPLPADVGLTGAERVPDARADQVARLSAADLVAVVVVRGA